MSKKIAFVIIGWNNADLLPECFDSIHNQTSKEVDTYYVDNGSKDNSVELVKRKYPWVKLIDTGENTGFAKGNNIGIDEALKDPEVAYIGLLNSDARLKPDWTEKMVNFAEQKPKGALFQGTTLDYYDESIIDSTHIYVAYNGAGTQGNWRYYFQQEFGPRKVFGVNAAACMISRRFIEEQPFDELFDEQFFMYLEDVDLAARATVLGWDNYLVSAARALHMGSASSGKNPGFSLYMTFRNNSAMLCKNFPLRMLVRMLPAILRAEVDTHRVLRRMGQKDVSRKVVKGRLIGLLRVPLFLAKRHKVLSRREIAKGYLWNLMRNGY